MSGECLGLLRAEHRGAAAKLRLCLGVVEPRIAPRDDEERLAADPQRQRLGDAPGLDPERRRRLRHRRGARRLLDQLEIGRMFGKPGAHGLNGHSSIFLRNVSGSSNRPSTKVQAAATTGYQSP